MILSSLMLVVLVKRLAAVVIVFLVLGLTVSSAMAASDIAPKSALRASQASGCPCCSGNAMLPENITFQELKGPTAYFKTLEAFATKNALDLRKNLDDLTLTPDFHNAIVQVVSSQNGTVEIIKVPLYGKYPAVLISIRNRLGYVTGVAVYKNNSVEIYYYRNGTLQKYIRILPTGIGGSIKCAVCLGVAGEICDIGYNRAVKWGCKRICGITCAVLIEDPFVAMLCAGVCYFLCQKILTNMRVKRITCSAGATGICVAVGVCKG